MTELTMREFHLGLGASLGAVRDQEVVMHYGDPAAEYAALTQSAAVLDLSCRSRLCLTGADRMRFLHGQVTNNVKDLGPGQGCYAALVNAKGRMVSDLNIYCLPDELLLDFEPGYAAVVSARLEGYLIADDVQVVDVAAPYGLVSLQGPRAPSVLARLELGLDLPSTPMAIGSVRHATLGEIYATRRPRGPAMGIDLFVPAAALGTVMDRLIHSARQEGGRPAGWQALETARIECGTPRFGADMDETNLAPETGIEARAISYSKGCYTGQEVIARIRTYGQVARALRGLLLPPDIDPLPPPGARLHHEGKEVGYLTSVQNSPALGRNIALGYVRRECNEPGTTLHFQHHGQDLCAQVVVLPFPNTPHP